MRQVRWLHAASVALLLTVFLCAGCVSTASSPPATDTNTSASLSPTDAQAKRIYDTFYPALASAIDLYTFANDAAKAAHESGVITADQVRALRLREAKAALETARSTAVVYLRALQAGQVMSSGDTSRFTERILAAQATVNTLLQLAKDLGVIQ